MGNKKETLLAFCDFETTGTDPQKHLPIEVALVITDWDLNTLAVYSSLINPFNGQKNDWDPEERKAFEIHKIPFQTLKEKGKPPFLVVVEINTLLREIKTTREVGAVVLVSDNAVFEYSFMKKLFHLGGRGNMWPFYYVVWDINVLQLLFPQIIKPEPAHRALGDALLTKEILKRALSQARTGIKPVLADLIYKGR